MNLFINVKHLSILAIAKEDELIKKLLAEFHFFSSPKGSSHCDYEVHLVKGPSPKIPEMMATKILPHALVYHHKGNRYIDYQGRALIHQQGRVYYIYCQESDFLFELAFLTLHSLLGDLLEDLGYYRIHALSGTYKERDFIVMLPSGGGKSSLLVELLNDPSFLVISDDSPIIDEKGELHSFPTKISLENPPEEGILKSKKWNIFHRALHPPKYVLSLSSIPEKINASPLDKKPILILGCRSSFEKPQLIRMNRLQTFAALLEYMVIGVGLPQVIEIFLNFKFIPDTYKMGKLFLKRSLAAFSLLKRSEHYKIVLSVDMKANSQKIKDLIDEINN